MTVIPLGQGLFLYSKAGFDRTVSLCGCNRVMYQIGEQDKIGCHFFQVH